MVLLRQCITIKITVQTYIFFQDIVLYLFPKRKRNVHHFSFTNVPYKIFERHFKTFKNLIPRKLFLIMIPILVYLKILNYAIKWYFRILIKNL